LRLWKMDDESPEDTAARQRDANHADVVELVSLLRQIDRQPELGRRLLAALERLAATGDPDLCLELARYMRRPIRSRHEAVDWVRSLHRVLLAAHRRH
jgi:hypothetical protein